jgi:hypothetical protein
MVMVRVPDKLTPVNEALVPDADWPVAPMLYEKLWLLPGEPGGGAIPILYVPDANVVVTVEVPEAGKV